MLRLPPILVLGLLLGLLAGSCAEPAPERLGPADGRDVVVVVIDTLRADHLATYGYSRSTAPFLEQLAERSVVFDAAYGASTWTAPSTASLFTSLYPRDHGVMSGLWTTEVAGSMGLAAKLNRIPPEIETLPEWFQSIGYRTYGFADNPNIDVSMGFARGFDEFVPGVDRGSPAIRDEVLEHRDELLGGERPYFLYLHLMDPHIPYEVQEPWYDLEGTPDGSRYREEVAAYDSEIGRVDAILAELWEALELDRDALVVITSDHGEEFGEHGGTAHGPQLHNELLRVPLVVHGADEHGASLFPPRRVADPACLIDLLPTLRGLAGQPAAEGDHGIDLSPALTGGAPLPERLLFPERPVEFAVEPYFVRSVIEGDLKLYLHSRRQPVLYDMALDPNELLDLGHLHPGAERRLLEALEAHFASPPRVPRSFAEDAAIDEELEAELDRLGYTGD